MPLSVRPHANRIATGPRRVTAWHTLHRVDPYLTTKEHRAWSREVLKRAGYACQDQAHDPGKPRTGILLHADHIVERRDGGPLVDLDNGMARCAACHVRKTTEERKRRVQGIPPAPVPVPASPKESLREPEDKAMPGFA